MNCDSALLINTICNGFAPINNVSEVRIIYDLCHKSWKIKWKHILHGGNKVIDCLAKETSEEMNRLTPFEDSPRYILYLFKEDVLFSSPEVLFNIVLS